MSDYEKCIWQIVATACWLALAGVIFLWCVEKCG